MFSKEEIRSLLSLVAGSAVFVSLMLWVVPDAKFVALGVGTLMIVVPIAAVGVARFFKKKAPNQASQPTRSARG